MSGHQLTLACCYSHRCQGRCLCCQAPARLDTARCHAKLECEQCEHCAIANCELLVDVMQVHLDGALGDSELLRDLFVTETCAHQQRDLSLARR